MASFAEYTKKKKKKNSAEGVSFTDYTKSVLGKDDIEAPLSQRKNTEDIAPVKTTVTTENTVPKDLNWYNTEISNLENTLKTVNDYESKLRGYTNRKNTWNYRTKGMQSDGGYGAKIEATQKEYDDYLASVGYADVNEINKTLTSLKAERVSLERSQELIKLSSVSQKDKEYDKYVKSGYSVPYDEVGKAKRHHVRGRSSTIVDNVRAAAMALYEHKNGDTRELENSVGGNLETFRYMTNEEFDLLAYYIAKDKKTGGKETEQYVDLIEETLNQRRAKFEFTTDLEGKTAKEILHSVPAGLDQFGDGVSSLLNTEDEYITPSVSQFKSQLVREDLADDGVKIFDRSLGQIAYDFGTTTANMAPSILVSAVSNAVVPGSGAYVGGVLMGASASGNAYQQTINMGWDKSQARTYSTLVGISEAALSATISKAFGGKILEGKIQTAINGIDNGLMRFAANYGTAFASEGFEEAAQEILNPLFENIALGYDENGFEDIDLSEVVYSGLLGGLSGGAFETVGAVFGGNNTENKLTENEQKVFDFEVEKRIAAETENGKKLTTSEKKSIENAVRRDLEKGYISTDTIEEVLGGESYTAYKGAVDNEEALQKEFDTLNKMKQGEMTGEQIDRRAELKEQLADLKANSNKADLKSKLYDEVYGLAKDSRLVESYNEDIRRGKAFEADLSQYNEKYQGTIKKAVESGILNNTRRTHEFVDMIAKISADKGVLFDFTDNERLKNSRYAVDGKTVNGFVNENGDVVLNINSAKALNSTAGHEITHILEGNKELYDALAETITEYAKSKGEYNSRLEALNKLYEGVYEGDTFAEKVNKELVADLVGDYIFTDKDFIRKLSVENRNIFEKIYDEIKYLCKVATAGSKEARELEKVKKTFADVYRESGNISKNAETDTNTTYSLSADSEGTKLSKEQSEYFKDSKMRDDKGNLKVMYHGSQDAGFHVFDPNKSDDNTSFFFVDRNDVAATYSGTSETYEAKTIRTAEDMNNFLAEIGYDNYKAVEKDGKFELLENNEHVAYSDTAQGIYEEFCWYEGVGEGDANYKVYLNLKNPLVVDAKGRNWNNVSREFSQEIADKYNSLTAEEKAALIDLAEWEDFQVFRDEILSVLEQKSIGPVANEQMHLESAIDKLGGNNINISNLFSIASDNFSAEAIQNFAIKQMNTRDYAQKAKKQGYDGVIFKNINDNGGYSNGSEGASTVAIAFNSNQIKSVANDKPTTSPDIRYSLSEEDIDTQINQSMTMDEAKQMIQRAFVLGEIQEWYDGEYKNGDEWLRAQGADEVAMYIENEYTLQEKYLNKVQGILDDEFYVADVLEAYLNGTLTGKEKPKAQRLDTSKDYRINDERFYSPQRITEAKNLFEIANQRLNNQNRAEVSNARAKILLFAHNKGASELLGLSQAELNKKLRVWGGYPASAVEVSKRINNGVANSNRWSGIENCSWLNRSTITDEEIKSLVKSVEGESDSYENKYIARTMLALDTHIDWSWLSIEFDSNTGVNQKHNGSGSGRVNGFYRNDARKIVVSHHMPDTVAHEMGHALDYQWARDLGFSSDALTTVYRNTERITDADTKQFFDNFKIFMDTLTDNSDIRSEYTQDPKEVFARFIAKFIQWVDNTGTGGRSYNTEFSYYNDKFTASNYIEFAKLLQEKAMLDAKKIAMDNGTYSLSEQGETPKQYGNFNIYGKDVRLKTEQDNIAPVKDTAAQDKMLVDELPENIAPVTEEEANALNEEYFENIDDTNAPPEMADEYYSSPDTTSIDDTALKKISNDLKDVLLLTNEETKAIQDVVQKYSTAEMPSKDELFDEIKSSFGEKVWTERNEDIAEVKNTLRKYKIDVSKAVKSDYTEYAQFMKSHFGKIRFSKDGTSVDQAYMDLSEMYPAYFPSDIYNPADQLERIAEVADMEINTENAYTLDDETIQEAVDIISSEIAKYKEAGRLAEAENMATAFFDDFAPMAENVVAETVVDRPEAYEAIKPELKKQPKLKRVKEGNPPTPPKRANILTEEPQTTKKKRGLWSFFKEYVLDKGMVFESLSKKTKNRELEAKWNFVRYADGNAQRLIGKGANGVKALKDIQTDVEKAGLTEQLYNYLYHKHNVDRMTLAERYEGVENKAVFGNDVTAEISQQAVAELEKANPELIQYANDIYSYNKHLRNMLVEGGVISQETANLWEEMYPHYVPIRRVGDEGLNINVPLDTGKTGVNAPIKRATGGNRDILPLFDTMAQRTMQTYKAIAKNSFGVELKNTLGTTIESAKSNLDEVIDSIDTQEELLQEGKNGKSATFTVFENGEKVTFEITDEMYDALKPKSDTLSYRNKFLGTVSNIQRGLLTEYNPVFMLTNAVKDVQDVLINSQHPLKTYAKFPKAIAEMVSKGKLYTEYMENGGEQNTYFDNDTNTFKEDRKGIKKVLGMPLDIISGANNIIERLPRLAEYIASRQSGRSVEVSMLDAARVTTNFAAGGDLTKFLNTNGCTFLNASMQGAVQQVRNIQEAKMNGLKGWVGLATKFAIAGLPSILLNSLMWDDDEDYEELSDYVKDNYYVVAKYGDGQFVRIPKGRTLAVIQNAMEQIKNAATGDDEVDLKNFLELTVSNLAPNNPLDSNIFAPITQVLQNKTWYGEDLVPTRLQDLPAAEQYDESTDAISKWLGEKINISPYKINYLLNQYSGGVGDVVMPMLTPEAERGDNSGIGNFMAPLKDKFSTDSVLNNQNVSDFYDTVDELTTNAKKSTATEEDVLKYKYMNSISAKIGELYGQKRDIQNDSSLTDSEKYQQVRDIQDLINTLAEETLNNYNNINIDGKYATVGYSQYRWYEPSETSEAEAGWQKISDKQLEKQEEVTRGLGITPADYWSNKEEYDYAYENPEKYAVAKAVGGYETYRTYSSELYDIKADKDASGKSISGSRKEKVADYVNSLDIPYEQKIILFKSQYNADDTHNYEIIDYLNNNEDISYDEMIYILKELGFTVDGNGNIYW